MYNYKLQNYKLSNPGGCCIIEHNGGKYKEM